MSAVKSFPVTFTSDRSQDAIRPPDALLYVSHPNTRQFMQQEAFRVQ